MSNIKDFLLNDFFVTGEPMIYMADVSIVLVTIAIFVVLTYFKKWKWLWKEWLTTVDHKKIGIMYILAALAMLFRGGIDALLMRVQLTAPNLKFLDAQHYNEIFTTHGTIMILFMAMPFLIGLINVAMPLQIGARDVAFPYLNAISFWLFFVGAMLFNLSFVIGGSPDAGWTSYTPLAEKALDPGVGENYYLLGLQLAGIGTLASGVNFVVTILKMRAPGMTLMRMPMFTWSTLITSVIIVFAFPVLTVALAMLTIDRLFGGHFFTATAGGMPMMWTNLFWIWGHPEVYIVILPAFGIFSDIISTFAGKKLFGYHVMVYSMVAISVLSFLVWTHHFFTMGSGAAVNSVFGISTMAISVPTGVKIFNWLLTMHRSKIRFTVANLWSLAFIPNFVIGGVTGVMLAVAAADYQYHNSYFLIAHFHNVLIAGTVFACFAGLTYWWPKMFGHVLNERLGKWTFWIFVIGYNVCFLPQYWLGFMGMTRRTYTYPSGLGWMPLNVISTVGGFLMGIGFMIMVYNVYYSARYGKRDTTGDPWNGRTLEWATTSPAAEYNFANVPEVRDQDAFWEMKKSNRVKEWLNQPIKDIHMPNNSGRPIIMAFFFFVAGFGLTFEWIWVGAIGLFGVLITMVLRSFENDTGHHIHKEEVERTEREAGRIS
ncbi:cytochrome aa3-600 menaquinol oxidase subunit 1 [Pullulanibacillus pueri]|uniref:Quinol oxidase subunit 1 n=1 Tax=Pullulanibacillus pueri TaxID=1437324 RepID=A0A8J2ZY63_9BACL|nr:cytochrome aa3 quinol oxidase subunit I [Pullulanibacillus pueri]MBM7683217.1 cytochrome aa3-600 menaquinol oxidase subunit 1 [Pullulanibacillus pueri]GGH85546.1 quinol oxidase subunit 1 [Pullulanibacillus pueri]